MAPLIGIPHPPAWPPLWRRVIVCLTHWRQWRRIQQVGAAVDPLYNHGLNPELGGRLIEITNQLWAELLAQPPSRTERTLRFLGRVACMGWYVMMVAAGTFLLVLGIVLESLLFWGSLPFVISFLVARRGLRHLPQYVRAAVDCYLEIVRESWIALIFLFKHF